VISRNR